MEQAPFGIFNGAGIGVFGNFGATDGDGAGLRVDGSDAGANSSDTQVLLFELPVNVEEQSGIGLFEGGFGLGEGQSESKKFDAWFFVLVGKKRARAFGVDPGFGSERTLVHMVESVEDPGVDLVDDVIGGNAGALVAKVGLPR